MAGLTREGFTSLTYTEVKENMKARLLAYSPNMDLSVESPDGQNLEIFSFVAGQAWAEMATVFNSNNPDLAFGAGLRNIGMISGLPYGSATRSQTIVDLVGTAGTTVRAGSIVSNSDGVELTTSFDAIIPASVQVVATVSGPTPVEIGDINTIVSATTGWDSVNNSTKGRAGSLAQTDIQFRNLRNKTVMRNSTSISDVIKARLIEDLGIEQVLVLNNDDPTLSLPDGTPPNTIHVTIGEVDNSISDEDIASIILRSKGVGCPTFGSTSIVVNDDQGNPSTVRFSRATLVPIFLDLNITYLEEDYAGSDALIVSDLITFINALNTGQDVVWSHLFGEIIKHAGAQVNSLELSIDGITYNPSNLAMADDEYANVLLGAINIVRTNT